MLYSIEVSEDLENLNELVSLQNQVKAVRLQYKLCKQKSNLELENLDNKLLEIMNDRGILASYLMSPLSKITNLENTTQVKLVKDFLAQMELTIC